MNDLGDIIIFPNTFSELEFSHSFVEFNICHAVCIIIQHLYVWFIHVLPPE